eukprot:s1151_g23.t1
MLQVSSSLCLWQCLSTSIHPEGILCSSAKFGLEASMRLTTICDVHSKSPKSKRLQRFRTPCPRCRFTPDPHPEADPKISVLRRCAAPIELRLNINVHHVHPPRLAMAIWLQFKEFQRRKTDLPGSIVLTSSIQIRKSFRMES